VRRIPLGLLGGLLLIMASPVPALAQGPGVGNPGPNVGNFGSRLVVVTLIGEVVSPQDFATSEEPGAFIERGEDDFFVPLGTEGIACTVGLFPPPPPGVGRP
jgi:hypothetical protein